MFEGINSAVDAEKEIQLKEKIRNANSNPTESKAAKCRAIFSEKETNDEKTESNDRNPRNDRTCFICIKPGHIAKFCRNSSNNFHNNNNKNYRHHPYSNKFCKYCKRRNHTIDECYRKKIKIMK